MSPEAAQGYYTITAWDDKNHQISHGFEIKEYGQNQDLTFCQSKTDQLLRCTMFFECIFSHMSLLVLPKYEVNIDFPSVITVQDKEVTLKVCAK